MTLSCGAKSRRPIMDEESLVQQLINNGEQVYLCTQVTMLYSSCSPLAQIGMLPRPPKRPPAGLEPSVVTFGQADTSSRANESMEHASSAHTPRRGFPVKRALAGFWVGTAPVMSSESDRKLRRVSRHQSLGINDTFPKGNLQTWWEQEAHD